MYLRYQTEHVLTAVGRKTAKAATVILICTTFNPVAYALSSYNLSIRSDQLPKNDLSAEDRVAWEAHSNDAALVWDAREENSRVGSTTRAQVVLEPGSVAVNALSLYVHYPTSTLQFDSIDDTDSAFTFSFVEYANPDEGLIVLHYFQPYPGISADSIVTDLSFTSIASGTSTIEFTQETKVLANDGYGTDVLGEKHDLVIVID